MTQFVSYAATEGVGVIGIDDGKVNAMSIGLLRELHASLDRAQQDGVGVLLLGRPGIFSAGFDLKELMSDPQTVCTLLREGAELCVRMLSFPGPIVTACAGHAYPMGAFLMLSADYRFGADGPFRVGMNEVAIGIVPPRFAVELARARLLPPYFRRTAITGELFSPTAAASAGFLDEILEAHDLQDRALAKAKALAALNRRALVATKHRVHASLIAVMRDAIDNELTVENVRAAYA